ncbi:hypothetical protein DFH07DRAFT_967782 [Mycena maculata]|uniref:Uncharacterized protein n=1 Tax=Mycena maculata TaxID=230809 RepID=A0AAD7MUW5_9AGAR|nr:hypothetical protein DFH07DRAFT_967782 [Mycena maculata]
MCSERYRDLQQASTSIISIAFSSNSIIEALKEMKDAIPAQDEPVMPLRASTGRQHTTIHRALVRDDEQDEVTWNAQGLDILEQFLLAHPVEEVAKKIVIPAKHRLSTWDLFPDRVDSPAAATMGIFKLNLSGQMYILDSLLCSYEPEKYADTQAMAEQLIVQLQHANAPLFLMTIKVLLYE